MRRESAFWRIFGGQSPDGYQAGSKKDVAAWPVTVNVAGGTTFGALLLGNTTLGFHQIFATNAANGLGSPTPPHVVSIFDATLSSLGFGSPISGAPSCSS
jgi:hypothetical protein